VRVLGISGSLRQDSYNARLLRAAAAELPPEAELVAFDGLADVPPYNEDEDRGPGPQAAKRLRDAIAGADALLIATPEYNASVPGVLKNAIDWASRPFPENSLKAKPVAVIGASTGMFGAVWAQAEVRKSLRFAGARVLEEELPVAHAEAAFSEDDRLRNEELQERLGEIAGALVREVRTPLEVAA
jgi:chromate reductase